jgi:hypothetical protein
VPQPQTEDELLGSRKLELVTAWVETCAALEGGRAPDDETPPRASPRPRGGGAPSIDAQLANNASSLSS